MTVQASLGLDGSRTINVPLNDEVFYINKINDNDDIIKEMPNHLYNTVHTYILT